MEYYPGSPEPYQTYFPQENQVAAQLYSTTPGVKSVILVIDGRMDGGEDWSPNLSRLTEFQVRLWANVTALLYCQYPMVSGIQVDLEPFVPPYAANTLIFVSQLAMNLNSRDYGCVNSQYPQGRSVSMFVGEEALSNPALWQAVSPNGFIIVSGYDLSNSSAGTVITPAQYGAALTDVIKSSLSASTKYNGQFSLGIPGAASTHEFTNYTRANGSFTQGYPMYSSTADNYLVRVQAAASATNLRQAPSFLGMSLWGFSAVMAYPPHSSNTFTPSNPFAQTGEFEWLQKNL